MKVRVVLHWFNKSNSKDHGKETVYVDDYRNSAEAAGSNGYYWESGWVDNAGFPVTESNEIPDWFKHVPDRKKYDYGIEFYDVY